MLRLILGCALGLLLATGAQADVNEIGQLRDQARLVQSRADSVTQQRHKVRAEAERLSCRIDSLKGGPAEEGPELQESLRASMGLVQRLVDIERRASALQVQQDSVRERLRVAYDWEIGVLIQRLSQERDPGLLAQLVVFQDERAALGSPPVGADLHYGAEMAINSEDGPEEIRQKMELMQGISDRLREDARQTGAQLRRLEAEARLRTRVRVFADEISLFDEHLPQGRVLARADVVPTLGTDKAGVVAGVGDGIRANDPAAAAVSFVVLQHQASRDPRGGSLDGLAADDPSIEIRRLKARLQEIAQLEAIVGERATTFRTSLDRLLEGRE